MNKKYIIDFEKFFELITTKTQNEKNNDSSLTEIWQPDQNGDLKLMNKEMVDNKTDVNNHLCGLRYDFINGLMDNILSVYQTADGEPILHEKDLNFGQRIIFDTFKKYGVIKEITK